MWFNSALAAFLCGWKSSQKQRRETQIKGLTHKADGQIYMQTLGVKILRINASGLMSKIQRHRFTRHESGRSSRRGIRAKSILAFLHQKKGIFFFNKKEAKVFYSVWSFACTCQFSLLTKSCAQTPCYVTKSVNGTTTTADKWLGCTFKTIWIDWRWWRLIQTMLELCLQKHITGLFHPLQGLCWKSKKILRLTRLVIGWSAMLHILVVQFANNNMLNAAFQTQNKHISKKVHVKSAGEVTHFYLSQQSIDSLTRSQHIST